MFCEERSEPFSPITRSDPRVRLAPAAFSDLGCARATVFFPDAASRGGRRGSGGVRAGALGIQAPPGGSGVGWHIGPFRIRSEFPKGPERLETAGAIRPSSDALPGAASAPGPPALLPAPERLEIQPLIPCLPGTVEKAVTWSSTSRRWTASVRSVRKSSRL